MQSSIFTQYMFILLHHRPLDTQYHSVLPHCLVIHIIRAKRNVVVLVFSIVITFKFQTPLSPMIERITTSIMLQTINQLSIPFE
jgi:hypothetical protein